MSCKPWKWRNIDYWEHDLPSDGN